MKNKLLFLVVIVLIAVYYGKGSIKNDASFLNKKQKAVAVKNTKTDDVINYEIEDYLVGVLAGEMPASFNNEALKAQAVASRTFAYYKIENSKGEYDLTNDTSSQVFLTDSEMQEKWGSDYQKYKNILTKAVKDTQDEVLTYNGKIIASYYFSMSNGYTENSELVFNESKDYLKSVASKSDLDNQNFKVTQEYSKEEFCNSLNLSCENIDINDVLRSSSNRVISLKINNQEYKGTDVRWALNLRSTDFDIEIKDKIYITTRGYGHGVGMSQYGANNMANDGKNYQEILSHYYIGTKIEKANQII